MKTEARGKVTFNLLHHKFIKAFNTLVMKHVLVFGTFDIVHNGHKYFLKEAKKYGNHLTVVIARDVNVKKQKRRHPKNNEKIRLRNIKKLKIVDKAFLGERNITYNLLKKMNPDVICIGYDQKPSLSEARKILEKMKINAVLKRIKKYKPEIYKTSLMLKRDVK